MRNIFFTLLLFTSLLGVSAQGGQSGRHMSPEEYRAKQRTYIAKHAELTQDEAERFFPLFFELQGKKWEVNAKAWENIPMSRDTEFSEAQYEQLAKGLAEAKIAEAQLEKEYLEKYNQVLSYKKILDVQRAEDGFQRDLLRKMVEGRNKERKRDNTENPQVSDCDNDCESYGDCHYEE